VSFGVNVMSTITPRAGLACDFVLDFKMRGGAIGRSARASQDPLIEVAN
jgi:hypothetical protein